MEEKDFINEGYAINAYPFLFWGSFVLCTIILIFAGDCLAYNKQSKTISKSPLLRVTNREFSLFLWQYPHLMRVHAKNKIGYLTGFQYQHKVNMELELSENYVTAPPNVLFHYHTWKRLISSYPVLRLISAKEFKEFLTCLEEWHPKNWPGASGNYCELCKNLDEVDNLNVHLPKEVVQAFFGWKNYFKEGEAINSLTITYKQLETFLKEHPNYGRNYWEYIVKGEYPNYLKTVSEGLYDKNMVVPQDEIAPFLKVALYNWIQR